MRVSLCVITKNEEKNIATCINSVKSIVDEIVIVDTGSTDNTVEIAKELGAQIHYFEWINDFAAARNYALSKVSGDWIIFLDADEYISKESLSVLQAVIHKADRINVDVIESELININQATQIFQSSISAIRVLRRNPLLGYRGSIHETIHKIKGDIKRLNATDQIKIFHTGYSADIVQEKKKSQRNIELLYKELEKKPNSSNIHLYLAEAFNLEDSKEKVLYHINKVFEYHNGNIKGIYQKSYFYQLRCMIDLNYEESEIQDSYNQAISFDNTYPDFEVLMGNYYAQKKEYKKGLFHFNECIQKMNNYEGVSESWITTNAKEVFKVVANIYYQLEEYEECIKYLLYILNVYKEDEESLKKLLEVLKDRSSVEEIFEILSKIYDMTVEKDKLIILRACVALQDPQISRFVKNLLENQTKKNRHTYY